MCDIAVNKTFFFASFDSLSSFDLEIRRSRLLTYWVAIFDYVIGRAEVLVGWRSDKILFRQFQGPQTCSADSQYLVDTTLGCPENVHLN